MIDNDDAEKIMKEFHNLGEELMGLIKVLAHQLYQSDPDASNRLASNIDSGLESDSKILRSANEIVIQILRGQ